MLVALTLTAVVLGMMTNSLRFSTKTVDVGESRIGDAAAFHQLQRALRRQLQATLPVRVIDHQDVGEFEEVTALDFSASSTELEYIAPLPGLASGPGPYRILLRIENGLNLDGRGGRLLMSYEPLRGDPGVGDADSVERVLLENFAEAQFNFLDTRQVAAADWESNWRHSDRLPDLVKLNIRFDDVALPNDDFEIIIALKATSPVRFGAL